MAKMEIDVKLWIEINKTLGFIKGTCEGLIISEPTEGTKKSLARCVDGIGWLLNIFDKEVKI